MPFSKARTTLAPTFVTPVTPDLQTVRPGGVGAFSFTTPAFATERFGERQEIFVTLRDDSPGNRGQDSGSGDVRSAAPPPPAITAYRAAACNDTPGSGLPACAGVTQTPCVDRDCGYLYLRVVFEQGAERNPYTCRITNGSSSEYADVRLGVGNGYDKQTDFWYGGGRVGVDCGADNTTPNEVHFEFAWPDTGGPLPTG